MDDYEVLYERCLEDYETLCDNYDIQKRIIVELESEIAGLYKELERIVTGLKELAEILSQPIAPMGGAEISRKIRQIISSTN